MGDLTDAEREALADACDAAYDFGDAWIRFLRNGDESMLLPAVEQIIAARETALREEIAAQIGALDCTCRDAYCSRRATRDNAARIARQARP